MYLQLFEMHEVLEGILFDVLDAVPVQVKVLEPAQAVEDAFTQLLQAVVVEEEGAQRVQMRQHSWWDIGDLVEAKVPAQTQKVAGLRRACHYTQCTQNLQVCLTHFLFTIVHNCTYCCTKQTSHVG